MSRPVPSPPGQEPYEPMPGQESLVTPAKVVGPLALQRRTFRLTGWNLLWFALALLVLLSLVRVISGASDLTSAGTVAAAIGLAVPIGMAGLGGLWSERSGVINIGLEGMMIMGTWGAGWAGYQWGPWAGLLGGVLFAAFGGLIHAIATVTFAVDHIVSGVAINILGLGLTQYLSAIAFTGVPGGGPTQSPRIPAMSPVFPNSFSQPLQDLQARGIPVVSDLSGILAGMVYQLSWITVIAALLFVLTWWVLWRTPFGLRLRSCGENPYAAESLGVNVYKYKYIAVLVSGALAGVAGSYLAIVAAQIYREGQTGGRGFIGLAAMIFGNWRPGGTAAGSLLFGYIDALQLRQGGTTVHALLLLASIVMALTAAFLLYRRSITSGVVVALASAAVLAWYLLTDQVPGEFAFMAPYVTTLLVLSLASQRLRPPKADGLRYIRGQEK